MSSLLDLPDEIIITEVLECVTLGDLHNLALVCRRLNRLRHATLIPFKQQLKTFGRRFLSHPGKTSRNLRDLWHELKESQENWVRFAPINTLTTSTERPLPYAPTGRVHFLMEDGIMVICHHLRSYNGWELEVWKMGDEGEADSKENRLLRLHRSENVPNGNLLDFNFDARQNLLITVETMSVELPRSPEGELIVLEDDKAVESPKREEGNQENVIISNQDDFIGPSSESKATPVENSVEMQGLKVHQESHPGTSTESYESKLKTDINQDTHDSNETDSKNLDISQNNGNMEPLEASNHQENEVPSTENDSPESREQVLVCLGDISYPSEDMLKDDLQQATVVPSSIQLSPPDSSLYAENTEKAPGLSSQPLLEETVLLTSSKCYAPSCQENAPCYSYICRKESLAKAVSEPAAADTVEPNGVVSLADTLPSAPVENLITENANPPDELPIYAFPDPPPPTRLEYTVIRAYSLDSGGFHPDAGSFGDEGERGYFSGDDIAFKAAIGAIVRPYVQIVDDLVFIRSIGRDSSIVIWNWKTHEKQILVFPIREINFVPISPDTILVTGTKDYVYETVMVYSCRTDKGRPIDMTMPPWELVHTFQLPLKTDHLNDIWLWCSPVRSHSSSELLEKHLPTIHTEQDPDHHHIFLRIRFSNRPDAVLVIRKDVFLAVTDRSESSYTPWESWGPDNSRILEVDLGIRTIRGPTPPCFGSRLVAHLPRLRKMNARGCPISIVDFSPATIQWAMGEGGKQAGVVVMEADPQDNESDNTTAVGPVTERRLYIHPTWHELDFKVETRLPYYEVRSEDAYVASELRLDDKRIFIADGLFSAIGDSARIQVLQFST